MAAAARDLLSVSGSEVDVERLFSGCRDELGIRRHALKADTVRVLTLLRSAYTQEDEVDRKLIKAAMEYDILPFANSILWRPDYILGNMVDGMNISSLYVHMLNCACRRESSSSTRSCESSHRRSHRNSHATVYPPTSYLPSR